MNIVSFNVNSVRLRIPQLQAVIEQHAPEVIGLQETKVNDPDFPVDDIKALGYDVHYHGQKTHYGVAIMTRLPCDNVFKGFSTDTEDSQKRIIGADFITKEGNKVTVINGYFPQGENRSHETKFPAKNKFYRDLQSLLSTQYDANDHVVVMGDFNVAPLDIDIGIGPDNAKRWLQTGKASFLPEEREWLNKLMQWGLVDTYREKYPEADDLFSWFDYRSRGFEREPKRGIRIDHLLATQSLSSKLLDSGMNYAVRSMEKPSDHCPIWSSFNI